MLGLTAHDIRRAMRFSLDLICHSRRDILCNRTMTIVYGSIPREFEMAQKLEEEFYTIREAARILRVSVSTIWRWIDSGRLPAYRVGQRRIRIRRNDLGTMIQPFTGGKEGKMTKGEERVEVFKMSPNEARDQLAVVAEARRLQEQILARREGRLLPPSWPELNQSRDKRAETL